MKKILLAILLLFILFIILVFVFVPGKIVITQSKVLGATSGGFDSCLHKLEKWEQWWPVKQGSPDSSFRYEGYIFKLSAIYSDGGAILVRSDNLSLETRIQTITKNRDSITVDWGIVVETGNNPFKRMARYLDARNLKKSMQAVFDNLCHFANQTENIYQFPIERTTFTEVILIASRFESMAYPGTETIYNAVTKLREYATSQGAAERYYPMINTRQVDNAGYETMVAISIDKIIPASNEFFISRMVPMEDRFLATEVTGGYANIAKAHEAVEKYMSDHSLSAPAIPFEILMTDRRQQPDSSKWKTKIFYPSM